MSEDLSIQGTIAETAVPDLFRTMIRSGETGAVSLVTPERHDSIYFRKGEIVSATTTDADRGLAEVLLRSGELDISQYEEATDRVIGSKRIGVVLIDMGFLGSDEILRAEENQFSNVILDALSYRTGEYRIDFMEEFPPEIVTLRIDTARLVLNGVQEIPHWSLVRRGIGRMTRLLRQVPGADAAIYHLELSEEESHIYSHLAEPQTVEAVCNRSYLSNFATCRTLWALATVNLIGDAESSEVDVQRATVELELELESIVERYNAAFQGLFSLVFQEVGDHTFDFMDRVVHHVSPETLPFLSGISMTNEGRVDFDQLLNNLISSGTQDQGKVANSVLSELLIGWIVETKEEFGEKLQSEVARIVEGVSQ